MAAANENVEIKAEKKGEVFVIRLNGRLDAITSAETERKILGYVEQGEIKILLDFEHVDYISSAGMRVLLAVAKKLRALNGRLVLCAVNTRVLDVLRMSGFDHVMDLQNNEIEALAKFR